MLANTGSIPSTETTLALLDAVPSAAGGEGERVAKKLSASSSAFWNVIGMGRIGGGGDGSLLPDSSSDVGAAP